MGKFYTGVADIEFIVSYVFWISSTNLIVLGVGLSATHISSGFVGLHFDEIKHYLKCNGDIKIFFLTKNLLIGGLSSINPGKKWSAERQNGWGRS